MSIANELVKLGMPAVMASYLDGVISTAVGGPTGPVGETGTAGPTGPAGETGPTGPGA